MHGSAARGIAIPFAPSAPSTFSIPVRLSALLAASFIPLPSIFYPLPPRSFRRRYPSTPLSPSISLSLSLFIPPSAALPHRDYADTRTRRSGHTANRKLNSQQRARRAWSQLRGARGTKLNDRGVFRLLWRRSYGGYRRAKWHR